MAILWTPTSSSAASYLIVPSVVTSLAEEAIGASERRTQAGHIMDERKQGVTNYGYDGTMISTRPTKVD